MGVCCGIFSDEDILADSDSDGELQEDILMDRDDATAARPKKTARGKQDKYIHEDADTIVDLADIKAMSSIACKFFFFWKSNRLSLIYSILKPSNKTNKTNY